MAVHPPSSLTSSDVWCRRRRRSRERGGREPQAQDPGGRPEGVPNVVQEQSAGRAAAHLVHHLKGGGGGGGKEREVKGAGGRGEGERREMGWFLGVATSRARHQGRKEGHPRVYPESTRSRVQKRTTEVPLGVPGSEDPVHDPERPQGQKRSSETPGCWVWQRLGVYSIISP